MIDAKDVVVGDILMFNIGDIFIVDGNIIIINNIL
jgi:hypothetical protein